MEDKRSNDKCKEVYTPMSVSPPQKSASGSTYTPSTPSESCSPPTLSPVATPSRCPSTPIPGHIVPAIHSTPCFSGCSSGGPLPQTHFLPKSASSSFLQTQLFPQCSTFDSKSNLSETSSVNLPICRICHMPEDETDLLISPCRCSGSLQYIHSSCLTRWLDICGRKSRKSPKCELCHYQYHRHKKFKLHQCRFPHVSRPDKVLHVIFIVCLLIMVACAVATVMCFLSDRDRISNFPRNKASLTIEEVVTLSCGVFFFVSFFIAMSVQIKAKHTIYQLFVKFILHNMEWEIYQYDKTRDSKHKSAELQMPLTHV